MVEFAQTVSNLTEASSNLYELIKGRSLRVYPDADIRLAVSRAVALETSRGWRIAKEKASHKIDVVVALAQAALGATLGQGRTLTDADRADWALAQTQVRHETERIRAQRYSGTSAPAESRLDGRGEDWAAYEDSLQFGQRRRSRWSGF